MQILDPEVMRRKYRIDAAETVFFERELQHIYAKSYDVVYPDLMHRMFVPVSSEAGPGATSVNYRQFDKRGQAKVIGQRSRDLPRVEVSGREFIRPVRQVGISYGYTLMEMRQAAYANRPLNAMRALAAHRSIEEILEEIALLGSEEDGIDEGFLNHSEVDVVTPGAAWNTLTPDQIIAQVSEQFQTQAADTNGVEKFDTLLLPLSADIYISTTPRSSISDTTIKEFLLKQFPNLKRIQGWYRLETAGAGDITRAVFYQNSSEKIQQEIPSDFEQLPVQEEGFEFTVPCMATTAGFAAMYPKSMLYVDGI